ncbi:DUF6941 family protein [Corynebacterium lubricantis]|uniref:DUF6941 family protein n=1 Tax=Corynebacterium lubricantis TaxID=541095 RepID=UPI00037DEA64|nr:hypothetical protein [Corynebacterium lubricantis]
MTAELDYAYLAEYAKTEMGTITAIGASFTEVKVDAFPVYMDIAVAGRVRKLVNDQAPTLRLEFVDTANEPLITVERVLEPDQDSVEYAGKTASVFAYRGPLPLNKPGLYQCKIYLNEILARELAFTAEG